ncbi:YchJ family protein [Flavobacterium sp.]|jgi:SEC-C motif-containing protein|uniref:YchJ family protein n=1 Tax=Flavobacterium sp. TaxID=239 RepID=UPI0037BFD13A
MANCYCGSNASFEDCCQVYIKGIQKAPTAEALMRSRYSAYAIGDADYLVATTHYSTRKLHRKEDILEWSQSNHWKQLEVLASTETTVKFKAYYSDYQGKLQVHEEHSAFVLENGSWFYVDGEY